MKMGLNFYFDYYYFFLKIEQESDRNAIRCCLLLFCIFTKLLQQVYSIQNDR